MGARSQGPREEMIDLFEEFHQKSAIFRGKWQEKEEGVFGVLICSIVKHAFAGSLGSFEMRERRRILGISIKFKKKERKKKLNSDYIFILYYVYLRSYTY